MNMRVLRDYWQHLYFSKGNSIPYRSALKLQALGAGLGEMFVLSHLANGQFRFRFAGSLLCERIGIDLRGMVFQSAFTPDSASMPVGLARQVTQNHIWGEIDFKTVRPPILAHPLNEDRENSHEQPPSRTDHDLSGKILLLPMRSEIGEVDRIIGVCEMATEKMPTCNDILSSKTQLLHPYRARLIAISRRKQTSRPNLSETKRLPSNVGIPAFSEPATAFMRRSITTRDPKGAMRTLNLRIISGNRSGKKEKGQP